MTQLTLALARRVLPSWDWRQWAGFGIAAMLIACLPWALSDADWLELPAVLWRAAIWGSVAGWLASKWARRSPVPGIALLLLTGVLFTGLSHSRALPPLASGLRELGSLAAWAGGEASGLLRNATTTPTSDDEAPPHVAQPAPPLPEWQAAGSRASLYMLNLQRDWPPVLRPLQWQHGQILLSSLLSLVVWLIAGSTVWLLLRGASAWLAFLPLGGLIATSLYLSSGGWVFVLLSLILTLTLDSEFALRALESRWQTGRTYSFLAQEWWFTTGAFAAASVVVMGITIGLTDPDLYDWVNERLNPVTDGVAQSRGHGSSREPRETPPGVWPRDHLLRGSIDLSQQPVMTVRTPGSPPARFYWKATTFDQYTGRGWRQSSTGRSPSQDRDLWPATIEPPAGYVLLRQEFRLESGGRQFYAAGRPVRLNYASEGVWAGQSGDDLIAIQSPTTIYGYEVLSWVPAFTSDQLRTVDNEVLPDWVARRYLQLPETLPDRITDLAAELSADAASPYDKAVAIQAYLRQFPYTLDLPPVSTDSDAVDTFLFELQRGYCDYYASAMIIMARSQGIPARLAIGYRMGSYDPETQAYYVTMADSHSWPELYFEGIGWIPFEPTAAYPALDRGLPSDWDTFEAESVPREPDWVTPQPADTPGSNRLWLLFLIPGLPALALVAVALRDLLREHQRRSLPPDQFIASVYLSTVNSAHHLGVAPDASQTPHEFYTALCAALAPHTEAFPEWSGDWQEREALIHSAARSLIEIYASGTYSPRHATRAEADQVQVLWPTIRRGLRQFRFARWLFGRKKFQVTPVQAADYG
jgi:transglutaminase-like putative cysteine protease